MVKVIFFDVGGTLIHPFPSVGAIYSQVAERHGVYMKPEDLNLRFKEAWKKQKTHRSVIDKAWWKQVVDLVFTGAKFNHPELFFEELYSSFEKKEAWHIFEDAEPTLKALNERKMRLAVASNWDSRLPELLKTLNLAHYFEAQFVSFEMGCAKPDRRFFQKALETMKVDGLEAIHVGDDEREDIQGAQNLGIRAYLIDRISKPKNSRALMSLDEILARI